VTGYVAPRLQSALLNLGEDTLHACVEIRSVQTLRERHWGNARRRTLSGTECMFTRLFPVFRGIHHLT
jgi:hypothetical protein